MRWARTLVAVTLALAAGMATAASAAQAPPAQAPHARWESRLQQQLGLSDQQLQAIREVHQRDAEARRQQEQQLRQAQIELRRLVLTGADDRTIQAKQAEVEQLAAQNIEMRTNTLKQVAPILTLDQREKLAQLMERAGQGRHRRQAS